MDLRKQKTGEPGIEKEDKDREKLKYWLKVKRKEASNKD